MKRLMVLLMTVFLFNGVASASLYEANFDTDGDLDGMIIVDRPDLVSVSGGELHIAAGGKCVLTTPVNVGGADFSYMFTARADDPSVRALPFTQVGISAWSNSIVPGAVGTWSGDVTATGVPAGNDFMIWWPETTPDPAVGSKVYLSHTYETGWLNPDGEDARVAGMRFHFIFESGFVTIKKQLLGSVNADADWVTVDTLPLDGQPGIALNPIWFNNGGSGALHLDDIVVNPDPIPEPATMVLLGLGGLVLRRRRRA